MLTKAKNTKSITIPAAVKIRGKVYRVTAVGPKAFRAAKRLTRARIGDNVTRIGNSAFSGCAKLTEVAGGASVQNVGAYAFSDCETLRQCAPLGSVKLVKIGAYALKNAKKLKAITVKSTKLKKSNVRKSLKDSAIATVNVLVGTIKANKTYAKRYAKVFTKKNCGKKVRLKGLERELRQPEKTEKTETAKKTEDATLANKWKTDFERLAKASGMEVCVYALDLSSGATASYQSDKKMLSASMIKLLIAETFLRQVADGKHAFDDVYVLKATDIVGGAGSLGGRGAGAKVTKREMLKLMISESDNVAANVLIDQCGIDAINEEAKRLGLTCTSLERHMMDTKAEEKGLNNYTCADDLGILLKMVYDKTFVNKEMSAFMLECLEAQTDNRCISKGLPEGTIFAHKTGSLSTVRHDGGIVEGKRPFIIVTLCGGKGYGEDAALDTMKQIGKAAYEDLQEAHKSSV
ncbi:MAG: serine hydrolase [Eggerthellaceae bacterium]|nr:serine hydrolase [Eggerthellaceae bacterium]